MTDINEKKEELRKLEADMERLMRTVRKFQNMDSARKNVIFGYGVLLLLGGLSILSGSLFFVSTESVGGLLAFLCAVGGTALIFFGARVLLIFVQIRRNFRLSAQVIKRAEAKKAELEREIAERQSASE